MRLRWINSSRPELDLQVAFCRREKLEADDNEAQQDAVRILHKGFTEIRQRYPDWLAPNRTAGEQVRFIAKRASSHLAFAFFIIRFIGDKHYDDPYGQLEVCLKFLNRPRGHKNINPIHVLDLPYTRILSDIPAASLPVTQRILGLFMIHNGRDQTAVNLANFLDLNRASFYSAFQRLHSVLIVHLPSKRTRCLSGCITLPSPTT